MELYRVDSRGVRNPMKMLDIVSLKAEPKRPQSSKTESSFPWFSFQKTDFGGLWTFFHVVSFAVIHLAA